jgi:phenylalanyl-tRNA synthetase beta chain
VVTSLCGTFNVHPTYVPSRHHPSLHPGRTADILAGNLRLGVIGELHPTVAERFDLQGHTILAAELDFELLLQARQELSSVVTPSRFPPSDRDIAIVVDAATPHAEVEAAIREAAQPLLESVRLFDIYTGAPIEVGRKSLAYSLRYRASDRTLEDDEVAAAHARVEETLRTRFRGEVRGR